MIRAVFLLSTLMAMIIGYQNCGGGSGGGSSESASSTPLTEQQALAQKANGVLMTRCQKCHNENVKSGNVNVLNLNEMLYYRMIVPGEPQLSILFNQIQDGAMPPAPEKPLSSADVKAISDWILEGFKGTVVPSTPPGATPLTPTFASIMKNILSSKCNGCHSGADAKGGINLTTYNGVRAIVTPGNAANSAFYTSVATRKTMPKNATKLDSTETTAIQTWINQGAMNN